MSFIKLGKLLFDEKKAKFFLSEKLSQDPVEEYFSKQRAKRGPDENPSLDMVNKNVLGLNVAGDDLIKVLNGNVRNKERKKVSLNVNDTTLLPTRPKKLKSTVCD